MFFDLTLPGDSKPYVDFCAAGRALRGALGDFDVAYWKKDLEEVSKCKRAIDDATKNFEDAFKNLDEEVHVVTGHGAILFCAVGKLRVNEFMLRVHQSTCCERARTRFGVKTYSAPTADMQLTKQQILLMLDYGAYLDACGKFIERVKSVVVCECTTPYQPDANYIVHSFRRW
jgi:hypothetical protein